MYRGKTPLENQIQIIHFMKAWVMRQDIKDDLWQKKKLRKIILTRGRNSTNIQQEKPLKRFRLYYKIFFGK